MVEQLVFLRMRLSPHVVVAMSFEGEGEVFQSDIERLERLLALMKDTFHSRAIVESAKPTTAEPQT